MQRDVTPEAAAARLAERIRAEVWSEVVDTIARTFSELLPGMSPPPKRRHHRRRRAVPTEADGSRQPTRAHLYLLPPEPAPPLENASAEADAVAKVVGGTPAVDAAAMAPSQARECEPPPPAEGVASDPSDLRVEPNWQQLVVEFMPLALKIATSKTKGFRTSDGDDIRQVALEGLTQACQRCNDRATLGGFVAIRVKGAIDDFFRSNGAVHVSRGQYRKNKDAGVRPFLDHDDATFRGLSTEERGYRDTEARLTLETLIEQAKLTDRERYVLEQYFIADRDLSDIAREMGVTESRVCNIEREALAALQDIAAGRVDEARKDRQDRSVARAQRRRLRYALDGARAARRAESTAAAVSEEEDRQRRWAEYIETSTAALHGTARVQAS
jgi:RNA polymerase sigma factor (sigma-70 family)